MGDLCRNAKELFKALEHRNNDRVIDLCRYNVEGGLSVCSIHKATVLHLVISNPKLGTLANTLLDDLLGHNNENQEGVKKLLDCEDAWGNTLLHCAAVSNNIVVAKRFHNIEPKMWLKRNEWGETAFFQACRHVHFEIFKYLAEKADEFAGRQDYFDMDYFFKREDNMNVLHVSIVMRAFDIAIFIAKRYPKLCKEQAQDDMSALQLLASNPMVFRKKHQLGFFYRLIYTCVPKGTNDEVNTDNKGFINKLKALITILIEKEDFWRMTYVPKSGDDTVTILPKEKPAKDEKEKNKTTELKNETALQMAVKNGITEIVEQILETCPQAVEQFNKEKQNLLHIAIKYRQIEIFDLLQKEHPSSFEWLNRNIDVDGNTILHMVGSKIEKDIKDKDMNPVKQLSEGLQLLTRLKKICPLILSNHINNDRETADDKFATNNKELHEEAKKWLERTAEHSSAVMILIASVAFAAAYTVPGGPNQETGAPVLLWNPFFLVFTMTDVLCVAFALMAVVLFLTILTSSFKIEQFESSLRTKLLLGFTFAFLSVAMMMVSFASTIILTIHNNQKQWTKIAVYAATFFPVAFFILSFIPLCLDFADIKIGKLFRSSLQRLPSRFACSSSCKHTQLQLLCICSEAHPQPRPDQPRHTHDV